MNKEKSDTEIIRSVGLCGCGDPASVHLFVVNFLNKWEKEKHQRETKTKMICFIKENIEQVYELILHFLNDKNFLEHGSSVYGSFLVSLGKRYIEIFKGCKTEEDFEKKLDYLENNQEEN